jgi:alkyl sulfatase BDS1-like metallo-beta-lactamase superfamily hydrolase
VSRDFRCRFDITDRGESWLVEMSNATLNAAPIDPVASEPATDARCALDKSTFVSIIMGEATLAGSAVTGDRQVVETILALNKPFPFWFDLVGR